MKKIIVGGIDKDNNYYCPTCMKKQKNITPYTLEDYKEYKRFLLIGKPIFCEACKVNRDNVAFKVNGGKRIESDLLSDIKTANPENYRSINSDNFDRLAKMLKKEGM